MKKREAVLVIGGISFLLLIIFLSLLLGNQFQPHSCGCPKVVSNNFIWLFILLAGVFVSCLLYYLFSLKIDSKEKTINKNMEILYSILDKDEKDVLKMLIAFKGELNQNEISKKYGKLKSHRIIKKLEEKGIIDTSKFGKTNKIKLKQELKKEFI